jgi:2',3'-cyclic-nucleotide 2'-phosphodiesterase/3'-nucleotidase
VVDVTKPFGERVIIKSMLNGEMFDNNKTYNVALSSYRANGGGDLLTKGAGIDKEDLEGIVLGKFNDIRSLIYDFYMSGNDKNIIKSSWKFIPEKIVAPAIKRDRSLLFGN